MKKKTKEESIFKGKDWYARAGKQKFKTLPEFIKDVQKEFPGYEKGISIDEAQKRYVNGIIAGILISLAGFHATSNAYGYSCNQAGVVRNCFYRSVFGEHEPLDQI